MLHILYSIVLYVKDEISFRIAHHSLYVFIVCLFHCEGFFCEVFFSFLSFFWSFQIHTWTQTPSFFLSKSFLFLYQSKYTINWLQIPSFITSNSLYSYTNPNTQLAPKNIFYLFIIEHLHKKSNIQLGSNPIFFSSKSYIFLC